MEHTIDHRVDPERMHPDYRAKEDAFRTAAAKLWDEESAARARIRANVGLSEEQRMDAYMQAYKGLEEKLDGLANDLGREVGKSIQEATETLYAGAGAKFSEHLASVTNVPDERLEALMNTATRSGQEELARAVAAVAYERGQRGLFERWAEANPDRGAAIERIKGTPGGEQFYARTALAMRLPKAGLSGLVPTTEDHRKAAEAEAARNRPRAEFFGPSSAVRRQAGRRVS